VNDPALPHLRLLQPAPNILAWYDGRVPGYRMYEGPNWVDDGAISLGIAAYAIVAGTVALVYDTHVSVAHARRMRADLVARGVDSFTAVLSHRHLDHVAGTQAFADGPVIAGERTAWALAANGAAIEAGTFRGPPAIDPLILPGRTFAGRMELDLGALTVELLHFDIHSDDATVLWLPESRTLLAGDTLDDPVTFVAEPDGLGRHLAELDRLASLGAQRILPGHGDPSRIGAGGYGPGLIDATRRYVAWLVDLPSHPDRASLPLREVIAADLEAGNVVWFDAYEAVHAENVAGVLVLG
jgi:glyoxylase-like metal-dependent hydrolase (beta-lactamase superfamily II)